MPEMESFNFCWESSMIYNDERGTEFIFSSVSSSSSSERRQRRVSDFETARESFPERISANCSFSPRAALEGRRETSSVVRSLRTTNSKRKRNNAEAQKSQLTSRKDVSVGRPERNSVGRAEESVCSESAAPKTCKRTPQRNAFASNIASLRADRWRNVFELDSAFCVVFAAV